MCLLYALFGIPFTGWLLATVGKFYESTFEKIARAIEKDFLQHSIGFKSRRLRKTLLYVMVFVISYGLLVLVPSVVFCQIEDWTFREAHYYSCITLSTIGFGDYVASTTELSVKNEHLLWLYEIAIALWYVFGLAYLACIITVVGKTQKQTATKLRKSMNIHIGPEGPEPPNGIGLSDVNIAAEEIDLDGKHTTCTCRHTTKEPRFGVAFKSEGTQTDMQ